MARDLTPEELELKKRQDETMEQMNDVLEVIFQKPISTLTDSDLGFLCAREAYLTAGQRDTYKDVMEDYLERTLKAKSEEPGFDSGESKPAKKAKN